ncbi:MAG: rhomboid family intramembrane serine protease [Oscillospiraceae bacterium]
MKKLMNAVDRFCYRHPRFGVRNLMLYIVIGNAIVWFFSMMDTTGLFLQMLTFSPAMIARGQIWRLVTFVLIPERFDFWLVIFLYFYYFIGNTLERHWGTAKFTVYYLSGILFTIIYGFVFWGITGRNFTVSASFINLSMFFSFATLYPDTRVLLFFFIPIKIKWLALFDAAFFIIEILRLSFPANLLPVVAVLNYLLFCGEYLLDYLRPYKARASRNTVNFRREARRINREQARQPYTRKCAVCGRTDTDYPNLEFRYCSRCQGYHCFCQDHINNHVHFTE